MPRLKDITGQRFGLLTVVKRSPPRPGYRGTLWECACDCGNVRIVDGVNLKSGRNRSCGKHRPKKRSRRRKDYKGQAHATMKTIWGGMVSRCTNSNDPLYGGRGIKVCARWRKLANFIADMGYRPSPQHTLDRYPDNNGNYEPGNVRWATPTEQANNRRSSRFLTALGKSMTVAQWGRETGLGESCIDQRVRVLRWSDEKAVTTPRRGWGPGQPKLAR